MSRLTETPKVHNAVFAMADRTLLVLKYVNKTPILGLLREVPAQVLYPKHVLQRSRGRLAVSARKVRLTPLLKGAPNGVNVPQMMKYRHFTH